MGDHVQDDPRDRGGGREKRKQAAAQQTPPSSKLEHAKTLPPTLPRVQLRTVAGLHELCKAETMVGTDSEGCDVWLGSRTCDPRHAVIYFDTNKRSFLVKDLKSRVGTFVNDVKVRAPVELRDKDVIRFGTDPKTHRVEMLHDKEDLVYDKRTRSYVEASHLKRPARSTSHRRRHRSPSHEQRSAVVSIRQTIQSPAKHGRGNETLEMQYVVDPRSSSWLEQSIANLQDSLEFRNANANRNRNRNRDALRRPDVRQLRSEYDAATANDQPSPPTRAPRARVDLFKPSEAAVAALPVTGGPQHGMDQLHDPRDTRHRHGAARAREHHDDARGRASPLSRSPSPGAPANASDGRRVHPPSSSHRHHHRHRHRRHRADSGDERRVDDGWMSPPPIAHDHTRARRPQSRRSSRGSNGGVDAHRDHNNPGHDAYDAYDDDHDRQRRRRRHQRRSRVRDVSDTEHSDIDSSDERHRHRDERYLEGNGTPPRRRQPRPPSPVAAGAAAHRPQPPAGHRPQSGFRRRSSARVGRRGSGVDHEAPIDNTPRQERAPTRGIAFNIALDDNDDARGGAGAGGGGAKQHRNCRDDGGSNPNKRLDQLRTLASKGDVLEFKVAKTVHELKGLHEQLSLTLPKQLLHTLSALDHVDVTQQLHASTARQTAAQNASEDTLLDLIQDVVSRVTSCSSAVNAAFPSLKRGVEEFVGRQETQHKQAHAQSDQLRAQLRRAEDELKDLQAQLDEEVTAKREAHTKARTATRQLDKIQHQLQSVEAASDHERQQLLDAQDVLKAEIEDLKRHLSDARRKLDAQTQLTYQYSEQLQALRSQEEGSERSTRALHAQQDMCRQLEQQLQDAQQQLADKARAGEARQQELEDELERLRNERKQQQDRIRALEGQLSDGVHGEGATREEHASSFRTSSHTAELEQQQQRIAQLEATNAGLQQALAALGQQGDVAAELAQLRAENQRLRDKAQAGAQVQTMDTADTQHTPTSAEDVRALSNELSAACAAHATLEEQMRSQEEHWRAEVNGLNAEVRRLQHELQQQQQQQRQQQEEEQQRVQELEDRAAQQEAELTAQVKALQNQLQEKEAAYRQLETENQQLLSDLHTAAESTQRHNITLDGSMANHASTTSVFDHNPDDDTNNVNDGAATTTIGSPVPTITLPTIDARADERLREELQGAREQLLACEQQRDELSAEVAALKSHLASMRDACAQAENDKAALQQQLRQARSEAQRCVAEEQSSAAAAAVEEALARARQEHKASLAAVQRDCDAKIAHAQREADAAAASAKQEWQEECAQLQAKLEALEQERETQAAASSTQHQDLQAALSAAEHRNRELQAAVDGHKQRIAALETAVQTEQGRVVAAEEEAARVRVVAQGLEDAETQAKEELSLAVQQLKELLQEVNAGDADGDTAPQSREEQGSDTHGSSDSNNDFSSREARDETKASAVGDEDGGDHSNGPVGRRKADEARAASAALGNKSDGDALSRLLQMAEDSASQSSCACAETLRSLIAAARARVMDRLQQHSTRVTRVGAELRRARTQLEQAQATAAKAADALEEKEKEVAGVRAALQQEQLQLQEAKRQAQDAEQAAAAAKDEMKARVDAIRAELEREKEEAQRAAADEFVEEKKRGDAACEELQQLKQAHAAQAERLEARIADAQLLVQQRDAELRQLASDKGRLQTKIVETSKVSTQLREQLAQQTSLVATLQSEKEQAEANLEKALEDVSSLVADKAALEAELSQIKEGTISAHPYTRKRIDTLTQRLAKADKVIRSLKHQLTEQQSDKRR
ncbi:hypothetical protein PTSG_03587 [Salpingoeca rosetta]|uniref:FHA domain-containing protein n=1 Tax=Salpingoeca rosetta (strain ATCC 50818 / BSB-021) TaxID=946362 RepID=F2U611_SALR5|nr:uncharacterized protein PTSG_03587 [Salpingoeca rosetta]EGD82952.1 hypothetical protein PTSG_03587 [Salpingoeca rosetta]|eukprot:XP_004995316.1 hypothetical protein PTSG_03587 [Salpingoeca rosetta]